MPASSSSSVEYVDAVTGCSVLAVADHEVHAVLLAHRPEARPKGPSRRAADDVAEKQQSGRGLQARRFIRRSCRSHAEP